MQNNNIASAERSVTSMYLNDVRSVTSLLSKEDEFTIAVKTLNGCSSSKKRFIESNLPLVISIAKNYQNRGIQLNDLISEGNLGLIRAVEKFDPYKGNSFSTYATNWISFFIEKHIMDNSRNVRVPVHVVKELNRVNKMEKVMTLELKRDPTSQELAERLDIPEERISFLLSMKFDTVSLDQSFSPSSNNDEIEGMYNFVPSDKVYEPDSSFEEQDLSTLISEVISSLPKREQDIVVRRFGLNGFEAMTLEEIGNEFNLSKERIRQIIKDTMKVVKENIVSQGIEELFI